MRIGISRIEVEGQKIRAATKIYLVLNKPRGNVTTAADEKGRDTVYSLLPGGMEWIAPVGRLDKASEGLLLLTNDSEWAARITDPRTHLAKTYHVQIGAIANDEMLQKLQRGIETAKGEVLRAKSAGLWSGWARRTAGSRLCLRKARIDRFDACLRVWASKSCD